MQVKVLSVAMLAAMLAACAQTPKQTSLLTAEKGFSGSDLGAKVVSVTNKGGYSEVKVTVPADQVPKGSMPVLVNKDNKPFVLKEAPKINLEKYESDYGIKIRMKRLPGYQFRVRFVQPVEQN